MSWISYQRLVQYTNSAIRPIVDTLKQLKIFKYIKIGDNAIEADSVSDILEFTDDNKINVTATSDGSVMFSLSDDVVDSLGDIRTTTTLYANKWNNNEYSFEENYPNSDYDLSIAKNGDSITSTQITAWDDAEMEVSATENKIIATGSQPDVDIPIILVIKRRYREVAS